MPLNPRQSVTSDLVKIAGIVCLTNVCIIMTIIILLLLLLSTSTRLLVKLIFYSH